MSSSLKGAPVTGGRYTLCPGSGLMMYRVDPVGSSIVFSVPIEAVLKKHMVVADFPGFMGTPSGVELLKSVPHLHLLPGCAVWIPAGSIVVLFTAEGSAHSEMWFQPIWSEAAFSSVPLECIKAMKTDNVEMFKNFSGKSDAWKTLELEFLACVDKVVSKKEGA